MYRRNFFKQLAAIGSGMFLMNADKLVAKEKRVIIINIIINAGKLFEIDNGLLVYENSVEEYAIEK